MTTANHDNGDQDHVPDAPLARAARQRRRDKADRGLPPDDDLRQLAAEYLRVQRRLWPKLVTAGLLPEPTDAVVAAMAEDFKGRHRTGAVDPTALAAVRKLCPTLAGDYSRFSCDNSSPKSVLDQMANALERARQDGRFVPWQYVFADYSVSGLSPSRQGYSSYKAVLQEPGQFIETTYIDDFTRASRDEVEWWRLAHLSRRLGKRMVGAADGFDLSAPNWDTMVAVYGLISRLFIKGLREKVGRGMRGAARRGGCLGKLPLGFTRAARRDRNGQVVRDRDGRPEYVPCVDPATRDDRRLLYELYVEKCWSVYKITQHFNARKVDGWNAWTESGIKKMLWSASAVGVFMWNKTRREYDWEAKKWVVAPNPRADWVVRHDPALAVVPLGLWAAARKRLSAARRKSPSTGRPPSRNQKSASTLFSGTLVCGYCGHEITLWRSSTKYKMLGCVNGPAGKHGCRLTSSKSTRIVESALLGVLRDRLLTEAAVGELVARANAYLAEEACKPRADVAPLRAAVRASERAIQKLFDRVAGADDEALVQAYEKQIAALQRELNDQTKTLRETVVASAGPPAPLDTAGVGRLLADLRGLLSQEVPAAAEAIRGLTGPITIHQEREPGQTRGANWVATFQPDLLAWLRRGAKGGDYPDSVTLEYLRAGNWTTPEVVTVAVDHVPKHERLAAEVKTLIERGAKRTTIAAALGETYATVKAAAQFARTGAHPLTKPPGRRTGAMTGPPKYQTLAPEVARLRDAEGLPFPGVAAQLGMSEQTARRAYDHFHKDKVVEAVQAGRRVVRGRSIRVGETRGGAAVRQIEG